MRAIHKRMENNLQYLKRIIWRKHDDNYYQKELISEISSYKSNKKNELHTRIQSHSQGTRTIHTVQNSVRNTTSLII